MTMRDASAGRVVFALTMIGLGVMGLMSGEFAPIWQPVPRSLPARETLASACSLVSLVSGLGLLLGGWITIASPVLLGYLLVGFAAFRASHILKAPASQETWSGCAETAVVVAGAWVLFAWFADKGDRRRFAFATGDKGVRIGRAIYGLCMIPFGLAHFNYLKDTASLVPSWLPWHLGWAVFTGSTFIAAGLAILAGVCARLAAALSAVQLGLFTLLVWVPVVLRGPNPFQWSEFVISATVTAGAWVVADSYRGVAWFAVGKR
jgi:uncharacterized membrane protein